MNLAKYGFSGATIKRVPLGVEKAVSKIADAPKLKAQYKMQRDWHSLLGNGSIRAPKVYGGKEVIYVDPEGKVTTGLLSMQMEYIDGDAPFDSQMNVIPRLADFVLDTFRAGEKMHVSEEVFAAKIDGVWAEMSGHEVGRTIQKLRYKWPAITMPLTHGLYHGDLTLCNVIVDSGTIYLIDFTPQIAPLPLFDMVKLRQDTMHGWFRKVAKRPLVDDARLASWDATLHDAFKDNEEYKRFYFPFQALGLARILPYAKHDDALCRELAKEIEQCLLSF